MKNQQKKSHKQFTVVVPTIRENNLNTFLQVWEKELSQAHIIVVEDNPEKSFKVPSWVEHYSWNEIDTELKDNSWIIPRRSGAIRSFGFYKAWDLNSEFILTLDDDCYIEDQYKNGGFLEKIETNLNAQWQNDSWWSTLPHTQVLPRGYPYSIRKKKCKTVIHHGLWSGIPDLDGTTQKKIPQYRTPEFVEVRKVPFGKFYPMSSMNLAFRREVLPIMYHLLMGGNRDGVKWNYDRFDDIWTGIITKKIFDHLGLSVSSGGPSVFHSRASNVDENIVKEKNGIFDNEWLWKFIHDVPLKENDMGACYREIASKLAEKGPYWRSLSQAMKLWVSLFE